MVQNMSLDKNDVHSVDSLWLYKEFVVHVVVQNWEQNQGANGMSRRVTVMIDDDVLKKLRTKQAMMIKRSSTSVSLSKVITEILDQAL